MRVKISGRQVDTGEALQTHVEEHLSAVRRKYFDHALDAEVTFSRGRGQFACAIQLHAGRGVSVHAEGEGADAHRAFADACEHLAKQLRRWRRRVNEHARSLAPEREALSAG